MTAHLVSWSQSSVARSPVFRRPRPSPLFGARMQIAKMLSGEDGGRVIHNDRLILADILLAYQFHIRHAFPTIHDSGGLRKAGILADAPVARGLRDA